MEGKGSNWVNWNSTQFILVKTVHLLSANLSQVLTKEARKEDPSQSTHFGLLLGFSEENPPDNNAL